jgi:anti-sigma factor RsiW
MAHDLVDVAAYVARELPVEQRAQFERHLLVCADCSAEVELGDRGRQLAGLGREAAPAGLHYRVAALSNQRRHWYRRPTAMAVAAAAAAVLAGGAAATVAVLDAPPAAIGAAAAGFRAHQLPSGAAPAGAAPNLAKLGLSPVAARTGELAGQDVMAYAYRDSDGHRLTVYTSQQPFATPSQAEEYGGNGAWMTRLGGVSVLCGRAPHQTMVVGQDDKQVATTAQYLNLM